MSFIRSTRRLVAAGALGVGLLAAPAVASAAPAVHHTVVVHHPVVHRHTVVHHHTTAPVTRTYTVIAGTFRTQAQADKRLAAITAKGVNGLSVVKIGKTARSTRYRVEEIGLTRAAARTLWKQLHHDHFFAFYTAR